MKLAIIHADPKRKLSARLTLWWTGSTAYHCGFVDESDGTLFDMNLIARKVPWPRYFPPIKWVVLYEVPGLTRAQCEAWLRRDSVQRYSVMDYLRFALRPLYHLFGKSTRNASGLICSELCALWLSELGLDPPIDPIPSPAALEAWARVALKS
jgi:hypothetical protein